MQRAGLGFVFLWFLIGGAAHFVATDLELRIVPPWFPWPRAAVLVSGALELLGAAGLLGLIAWSTFGPPKRPPHPQGSEPRQQQR